MARWQLENCDHPGLNHRALEAALNGDARRYARLVRYQRNRGDVSVAAGAASFPLWPAQPDESNESGLGV